MGRRIAATGSASGSAGSTALALVAVAIVLAGATAGCGNRQPARFKNQSHEAITVTPGADGVQRVTIDATDADRFVPDTVVVHPGEVVIVVHNDGVIPHTFEIPGLNVNTGNIAKHQVKTVRFTVGKPGTYPFDCAYHVTLHMDGTLKVVGG